MQVGGCAECAFGQEDGHAGFDMLGVVGRRQFVQIACRSEDIVALVVVAREALLALQQTNMNRQNGWVVLARVVDVLNVAQRCLGVEQMVRASGESEPLGVRLNRLHQSAHVSPRVLNRSGHAVESPMRWMNA